VIVIVFDTETYSVQYGTDMIMLSSTSEVINGNDDVSTINEVFSVNITGLTPFTTYYYTVRANNTIGSITTAVMHFRTNETGIGVV